MAIGSLPSRVSHSLTEFVPNFGHALTEIDLDSSIVHQGIVHLEICFSGLLLRRKLHKGVLQRSTRILVPDNLSLYLFIEA
jgi:hypothetical protein